MLVCIFNLYDIAFASLYTPAIPGHLDRILLLRSARVCMNLIFFPHISFKKSCSSLVIWCYILVFTMFDSVCVMSPSARVRGPMPMCMLLSECRVVYCCIVLWTCDYCGLLSVMCMLCCVLL